MWTRHPSLKRSPGAGPWGTICWRLRAAVRPPRLQRRVYSRVQNRRRRPNGNPNSHLCAPNRSTVFSFADFPIEVLRERPCVTRQEKDAFRSLFSEAPPPFYDRKGWLRTTIPSGRCSWLRGLGPPMHCNGTELGGGPEAVRQAVGGGCRNDRGRLLSVTNAMESGSCRQGDSGRA